MAMKTVGRISAGTLICALQRAWELPPELCRLTALFWESRHVGDYRRCVMMELEALCVRVALMASCLLRKAPVAPVGPFRATPRVWKTTFAVPDADSIPLFDLPLSDVVVALDARVRQLPFLERYAAPACHPDSSVRSGKCVNCGATTRAYWLDDWAKFSEAYYPDAYCAEEIFVQQGLQGEVTDPLDHVFARVWQLCHAGGTGTYAEKTAQESGTIEDALGRFGCLLDIQFEHEYRTAPLSKSVRTHVISVTVTETIRSFKPFEQTGVECLRDVARHPKRTCGSAGAS